MTVIMRFVKDLIQLIIALANAVGDAAGTRGEQGIEEAEVGD